MGYTLYCRPLLSINLATPRDIVQKQNDTKIEFSIVIVKTRTFHCATAEKEKMYT